GAAIRRRRVAAAFALRVEATGPAGRQIGRAPGRERPFEQLPVALALLRAESLEGRLLSEGHFALRACFAWPPARCVDVAGLVAGFAAGAFGITGAGARRAGGVVTIVVFTPSLSVGQVPEVCI